MTMFRPVKMIIIAAYILSVFGTGVYLSAGEAQIFFKEKSHDFRVIKQGETVTHVFIFKNTGGETLYIREIDAG